MREPIDDLLDALDWLEIPNPNPGESTIPVATRIIDVDTINALLGDAT